MGIRARIAGVVAAGVLVMAPIALWQQPAFAADVAGNSSAKLTFVNFENQAVTCTLFLSVDIDKTHSMEAGWGEEASGGLCTGVITMVLHFKDASGTAQTMTLKAYSNVTSSVTLSNVYTPVTATATNVLSDCDTNQSATCTFSTSVAPK